MAKVKVEVKGSVENALKRIEKMARDLDNNGQNGVKIGLPKGANNYPDGTSVVMVGSVHEFGSPSNNVPQRSFLRSTLIENKPEYLTMLKKLTRKVMKGEITMTRALSLLGLKVETDVKSKITSIDSPPLKSREGNPLIDTGHLRQSITHEVTGSAD